MKRRSGYLRIVCWVVFCLSGLFAKAHQQFNASCLNVRQGKDNAVLIINLEPSLFHIDDKTGVISTDLLLRISFRQMPMGRITVVRQKVLKFEHDFMSGNDAFFYNFSFDVVPGHYQVIVEIEDKMEHRAYLETLEFESRDLAADVSLSDPVLVQEFGGVLAPQPLLGDHITAVPDHLSMSALVYTRQPGYFRARAVLYKRQNLENASAADVESMQSSQFLTMSQFNTVVDARSGTGTLNQRLDLAELQHGEYLLEIYLFRDDVLVAEATRNFVIDWKHLREVFADLDAAIDQMAWLTTADRIAQLKSITDADEQQRQFLEFWSERANPSRETAVDAIERYYSRIFYAMSNFDEGRPGWLTDRGKTFTLYGPPDHKSSLSFQGFHFEIWAYTRWGMKFLFRNDDGKMRQIQIS
jgi:GWxTD domain-containing protein